MTHFGVVGSPIVLADTWSEQLVGWLTSPAVSGLLMLLGILGIYTEMRTPGVGLPGAVGVVCLAILFGSHYLMGLAAWWEIAVFLIGVVLIALEVFVIPGFGIAGIAGGLCCIIGVLAMFVDNPVGSWPIPSGELSLTLFANSVMALAFAAIGAFVLGAIIARCLPGIPILGRLVLAPVDRPPAPPVPEESPRRFVQIGDSGTVESVLRPVGKVRFGEVLLDAVADGKRIDVGAKVRVLRHDGNRLIVEQVEKP